MIKYFTRSKEHSGYEFESLISFDGRNLKGNNFFTRIPISPKEYRKERGKNNVFVNFWKGETNSEFVITDDWDEQHVLLMPNDMSKEIEEIKANILASDIPSNIKL
jgi:hypothetical protein